MANVAISDLATELAPGDVDARADVLEVDDVSAAVTKKVTPAALQGGPSFGPLLWRWNKLDVTQFDSVVSFKKTTGAAVAGSAAISYVANAHRGLPAIRVAATAITGGFVFPVKLTELNLPQRFLYVARVAAIGTSLEAVVSPFFETGAGTHRGFLVRRAQGSTVNTPTITHGGILRASGVAGVGPSSDTWDATLENRGGGVYAIECWRQAGEATPDFLARIDYQDASNHDAGALSRQDLSGAADPATDWANQDLELFGLGVLDDVGGNSGDVDFLDLRIYGHPLDH